MKKVVLWLLALITTLSFVACSNPAGSDGTDDTTTDGLTSEWWIKGSFDNWTDDPQHFFTMDELDNNILSFEITDLFALGYEFVLVNPAGNELKSDGAITLNGDGDAETITYAVDSGNNFYFDAAYSSYTVQIDITDTDAPVMKLIPGDTTAAAPDFATLADNLKIKGDLFSIGWTDTAGDADDATNTVTFHVVAGSKTGSFGFNSLDGFLKNAADTSTYTTVGDSSGALALATDGSNCTIENIPNSDSEFDIIVTIDPDGATVADKYSMEIVLSVLGTVPWAFEAPSDFWLVGDIKDTVLDGWDETDAGRVQLTLTDDVATYTWTATADGTAEFKYAVAAESGWNNLVGYSGIDGSASTIAVSDVGGNITFPVTSGTEYTLTVDFSGTYTATGLPEVDVASN
ncbi:MAG: hypothetical protein JXR86_16360 [Spirochaetales bacterium]|nr:hypothetical protein [Spirochaetales bacterium]